MVWEQGEARLRILEESARIKDLLLPALAEVHAKVAFDEDALAAGVRQQLGYAEPEPVDAGGLVDARVTKLPMVSPRLVAGVLPLSPNSVATTLEARQSLADIHAHRDDRLVVGLGECAVYNPEATIENAEHVRRWQDKYPELVLLLRTFFEKPRTPVGIDKEVPWKGFMYDPNRDGTNDINLGVIASRMIVSRVTDMGVPTIKEQLNALTPQYLDGAVAQDNIGARNVSDQKAAEYASGSSAATGHKNGLDGDIEAAMQAAASARRAHSFLGIDSSGNLCLVRTAGNETSHVVLRGGKGLTNYGAESVEGARKLAEQYGLDLSLDIDASHGNSQKQAKNQLVVVGDVSRQIAGGEQMIRGVQLETALIAGKQSHTVGQSLENLTYGQSITDECLGMDDTEQSLDVLNEAAAKRKEQTKRPLN